ncbi:MAG TPA: FAD-binding oxidoreductase [Stellaceae bacterium]|jgi:FAD/FMN-containing dehydrogenase|nr:FAD-binding oxidoreductase [Stellaceae bacterium]
MTDPIEQIKTLVGNKGFIADAQGMAPFLEEERGLFHGAARLVVRPASTAETAAVVRLCAASRIPMVPQGGNTGLSGGGVPAEDGRAVVLSLGRMNRVRALDPMDHTITVEAGSILADVQRAAAAADRLFPLSLGAEGSCQIGGNLATNAGGIAVLHYGTMRELTLGLEVVLPDGQIWDGLRALRKDNTGYDLKQLFIGSEGTLGIITAATLKLFPRPRSVETAFLGLGRVEDAMALFAEARASSGDQLTAFELIPRLGLDMALAHVRGVRDPLANACPWYVLLEVSSSRSESGLRASLEAFLAETMATGLLRDGVVAASAAQGRDLWRIREGMVEAQKHEGGSIKHDVSVPVSRVADFILRAIAAVEARLPGIRPLAFGHVGDGNIHFNLSQPPRADTAVYLARRPEFNHLVHDLVQSLGGSISAEHGIGRLRREELKRYKSPLELALMRRLKQAFDPDDLMNPGKILPP